MTNYLLHMAEITFNKQKFFNFIVISQKKNREKMNGIILDSKGRVPKKINKKNDRSDINNDN